MRWVVLLLSVAVVLPTVCLLWFMQQAVRNERLAMLQKLKDIYQNRLEKAAAEKLGYEQLNFWTSALVAGDGFLVYDADGAMTFPVTDVEDADVDYGVFVLAHELEFGRNDPNRALDEYRRIAIIPQINDITKITAEIGCARCLRKLNRLDQAMSELMAAVSKYDESDIIVRVYKCRARIMLLDLLYQTDNKNLLQQLSLTYDEVLDGMATDDDFATLGRLPHVNRYLPTSLQVFVLNRWLEYATGIKDEPLIARKYKLTQRLIGQLEISLRVAPFYPQLSVSDFQKGIFRLATSEPLYGVLHHIKGHHSSMMIFTQEYVTQCLSEYIKEVEALPSFCRIYNEKDDFVAGSMIADRKPFFTAPLGSVYFPDWTVELYVDDSAFDDAAGKQIALYTWTCILVIALILVTGVIATQTLGRQIRLNRLKNDFIATVTHELKTPLASTRVLVDTLLDGKYKDQQLVFEYLQLMSRENARLSRLIDNFLSFSRMERNKQAFDFQPVSPAAIIEDAVDVVKTKFSNNHCKFDLNIAEHLPEITADHDALVTVLVNLLDNACKYTPDTDKQIALKSWVQDSRLYIQVSDNGPGMSRRTQRRIFDRFYQADQTLSRPSQGCGLGLSIVKFIVDAHQGDISVESKPGQGSRFTVTLPIRTTE